MRCCQCHDHKFDPFTQKEYYQFYAFFNGIAEKGLDGQKGNAAPLLALPTPQQRQKLDEIASAEKEAQKQLDSSMPGRSPDSGNSSSRPVSVPTH